MTLQTTRRITRTAIRCLQHTDHATASSELDQALKDLSRRQPDITGAIQHSAAALESVIREVASDYKGSFANVLIRHPDLVPKPIDQAVSKVWGYASETARHVREGRLPGLSEASFLVGLVALVSIYLTQRTDLENNVTVNLYRTMQSSFAVRILRSWRLNPTPITVLLHATFRSCTKTLGAKLQIVEKEKEHFIGEPGVISRVSFVEASHAYNNLRTYLSQILQGRGLSPEKYVRGAR